MGQPESLSADDLIKRALAEADVSVRFIRLWSKTHNMMLLVNAEEIMEVHPKTVPGNEEIPDEHFDGSIVRYRNGDTWWVEESTKTIAARLGVDLG